LLVAAKQLAVIVFIHLHTQMHSSNIFLYSTDWPTISAACVVAAWYSEQNVGLNWRTFPILRSAYSWWVRK